MSEEYTETAKVLLLDDEELLKQLIRDKIKERFSRSDLENLNRKRLTKATSTYVYEYISDTLFEIYQKTGVDLIYDDVELSRDYDEINFLVKFAEDWNKTIDIRVNFLEENIV